MLDEYKRNGELFLQGIKKRYKSKNKNIDNLIEENFREPVLALVGHTCIGENASEKELLKALGEYFEVSGKSYEILSIFFKTRKGVCSLCGRTTEVFPNKAYIFPFERKIDSISPESARLQFCKECGFTLYCGMAFLYGCGRRDKRGNGNLIKFFFDSYNNEALLYKINMLFRRLGLRDTTNYNKIKFKFFAYHPYETLFVIVFEFVDKLKEKDLIHEIKDININDVNMLLVAGSGQLYETYTIEGSKLNKFVEFFSEIIDDGREIFGRFFNMLTVGQNNEEKSRLRNLFIKSLLDEKIDFITLNKIIMERIKNNEKYPFPFYYHHFLNLYMKIFYKNNKNKMEEQQMFEKINGLGYAIGIKIKGTNMEDKYVWEIFRTRGVEEFYTVLAELQAKLKMDMDLRPVYKYEKEWRKVKAILLNGILNALYTKQIIQN